MSLCSRVLAVLCALHGGCSAGEKLAPDAAAEPENELRLESKQQVNLLPGEVAMLEVRLLGQDGTPLAGHAIDFDLSDTLSGASLSAAQVATEDDGYARVELHAGTRQASFSVRVTAEGAEEVSFDVSVGDAVAPKVKVVVSYSGERTVASLSVTLVPGADCVEAANMANMASGSNGVSQVRYRLDQGFEFDLSASQSYALIAAARDDTNAKLASSCIEFVAPPPTADADEALVEKQVSIADVPLALGQGYAVTLGLDLQKPLSLLAPAASAAVSAALPAGAQTRGATFYLDAVQAQLAPADADELAQLRTGGSLDQALEALLESSESGPLRLASELSALVGRLGPSCSVQASYSTAGAGSFQVERLLALPSPELGATSKLVELGASGLTGSAALDASYDEASATLRIEALSLSLGLGSYANVLLAAARADAASFAPRLAAVHGCASVGSLVTTRSLPVTPAAALAACEQAAASLVERVAAAWQALDAAHPSLWLSGSLMVHDRNEDGVVDDLGPAPLSGSWSTAPAGGPSDGVTATLGVPARSALLAL
jgi:hypothetical protein